MLRNYVKIAIRNLLKYKGYSFINITGLAIGMACCALILLYVQREISYDNFHRDGDRVYRVALRNEGIGNEFSLAGNSYLTAGVLRENYPEVESVARIYQASADPAVTVGDQMFVETRFYFAEPTLWEVLTIPLHKGTPQTALATPNAIVLSEELAQKYFGSTDVIGRQLSITINDIEVDYRVTAVAENSPPNTHFKFDALLPLEDFRQFASPNFINMMETWFTYRFWTYIKLVEGQSAPALEMRLKELIQTHFPETRQHIRMFLQPLKDIHLTSHLSGEFEANNNVIYIYIFTAIALLVLVIACINFMNLATARSITRAREVGIRKVLGAHRSQLIKQFLAESVFISLVAVVLAMGLVEGLIFLFNRLSILDLQIIYLKNIPILAAFFALAFIVGLLAGIYPAFFLSAFQPVKTLKGAFSRTRRGFIFRKVLVMIQMGITVILLVGIMIISRQLDFVRNKELGFSRGQVLLIEALGSRVAEVERYESFKERLLQSPDVVGVTRGADVIGTGYRLRSVFLNPNAAESEGRPLSFSFVSHDYATVNDLKLLAGRDFSKKFGADAANAYLLNEAAVKALGMDNPIGQEIATGDRNRVTGPVVGVVRDFHYASLHEEIQPLVLGLFNGSFLRYIYVRIQTEDFARTMDEIETVWRQFDPDRPMVYSFLDQQLDQQYKFEVQLSNIIRYFTLLAIVIACLGLLGMAAFAAVQRTKEIGIRKVLGASTSRIIWMMSLDFVKLLLAAIVLAWPLAWFAARQWLNNFAYRTEIEPAAFLLSGAVVLFVALLTISTQVLKAARSNPVKALRYE